MATEQVKDKFGNILRVGDEVHAPFLGGKRHQGRVDAIVIDAEQAEREGISNPPKVIFTDKKGKREVHNPESLEVLQVGENTSVNTVPSV